MPRALSWVTWSAVVVALQGAGQFLLLAVLARHLSPAEFGVVTATLIAINLGRMMTQAAPGPALIQRRVLTTDHVRSAFALTIVTGFCVFACAWIVAPLVAAFFRMEPLSAVMRSLSLVFLVQAPSLVPEALLNREMRFRSLALCEGVSFLLGYVLLGIVLAMSGFGIWALVSAHLGHALVKTIALAHVRPHAKSLVPKRAATRDLLYISGGFLAGRFFSYSASQGDNFVVARWMRASDLGLYGRAYQLMQLPAMFLGEVIDRILFPLLARSQDDPARLRDAYERGLSLVATAMIPCSIAGVILAPEIVQVVLGPGWEDVTLPFQILVSGLFFRTAYKISDCLAQAMGSVYARAWRQAIYALLVFSGAFVGRRWGIEGVAVGILGAIVVNYVLMSWLIASRTELASARIVLAHSRGIVMGACVGVVTLLVARGLRQIDASAFNALCGTVSAVMVLLGLASWYSPRLVVGRDGLWIVSALLANTTSHPAQEDTEGSDDTEDRHDVDERTRASGPSRVSS